MNLSIVLSNLSSLSFPLRRIFSYKPSFTLIAKYLYIIIKRRFVRPVIASFAPFLSAKKSAAHILPVRGRLSFVYFVLQPFKLICGCVLLYSRLSLFCGVSRVLFLRFTGCIRAIRPKSTDLVSDYTERVRFQRREDNGRLLLRDSR